MKVKVAYTGAVAEVRIAPMFVLENVDDQRMVFNPGEELRLVQATAAERAQLRRCGFGRLANTGPGARAKSHRRRA